MIITNIVSVKVDNNQIILYAVDQVGALWTATTALGYESHLNWKKVVHSIIKQD